MKHGLNRLMEWTLRAVLLTPTLLPRRWRARLHELFIEREEVSGTPEEALRFLLQADEALARAIERAGKRYGGGEHPRHRLTGYHEFFLRNIRPGERVLDVGCGGGEVAADIAERVPDARVVGMDLSTENIERARRRFQGENLEFVVGDATRSTPAGPFDAVVLSNLLEHLNGRVEFLRVLLRSTGARRILIRVPVFERHWTVAMRKALNMPWFLDPGHVVENTAEAWRAEIEEAGLAVTCCELRWGEAWIVATPRGPSA